MTTRDERIFVDSDVLLTWTIVPDSGHTSLGDITLELQLPDGTTATPTVEVVTADEYEATYLTAVAGTHRYFWKAAGTVKHSKAGSFVVRPKGF